MTYKNPLDINALLEKRGIKNYVYKPLFVCAVIVVALLGMVYMINSHDGKQMTIKCTDTKMCLNPWAVCNNLNLSYTYFPMDCGPYRTTKCGTANCYNEYLQPGESAGLPDPNTHFPKFVFFILGIAFLFNHIIYLWRNR